MIFDTDVIIWLMRGKPEAAKAVSSVPNESRYLSVITYMELVQGVRDKGELRFLKKMILQAGLAILPLSENIGRLASELMDKFKLSGGLEVQDALIAATTVEFRETLFTGNFKHFKLLGIDVKHFSL